MTERVIKHELKTLEPYFQAVIDGEKKFEVRNNRARGFQKGDFVLLRENRLNYPSVYTGRKQLIRITYVTDYGQPPHQVVFSFDLINENAES